MLRGVFSFCGTLLRQFARELFFDPMACRESRGSKILLGLGLFVFATSLCHCTTLTRLKALDKVTENSMHNQNQSEESHQHHGRLLIGRSSLQGAKLNVTKATKNSLDVETDYQADMGWGGIKQPNGQGGGPKPDITAVERLLKMEPKVECTGDSMKLQVLDAAFTPGSLFFVDRGDHLSPLPLSKLPPSCGYSIRSTRRDLVLVAPYDGCFVALEEDNYVLPLLWWGLPVRMSCPLMRSTSPNPPMVTCHAEGMVIKTEWTISVSKIKVNLNGNWESLMKASHRCGFGIVVHPEGVVISVHYTPCLERKDGLYTLKLAGDGETQVSCPSLLAAQPESTKNSANGPLQQTEAPNSKGGYPSATPHPSASTFAPEQASNTEKSAVPEDPGSPQNPEMPNKNPNQEPSDIDQSRLPYYTLYPSFYYLYPASPDMTPAVKPAIPAASSPGIQTSNQRPQTFYLFPFYPQPPSSETTRTQPPKTTKPPPGKLDEHLFLNPFDLPPGLPEKPVEPSANQPKSQEQKPLYPFLYPSPPQHPDVPLAESPPLPLYPEKLPEKPGSPQPTVSEKPREQRESKPLQPEAPHSPVYHPVYPYHFYPQPKPATKPTAVPQSPQTEDPQAPVYQPFYPYNSYNQPKHGIQPATNPTAVLQPPQPEAPQGQVHHSFYPQPNPGIQPALKPAAVPQPPQPDAPQGQLQQPMYFYPQPELEKQPAKKTTDVSNPATETKGQQNNPCQPSIISGAGTNDKTPMGQPVQSPQSPAVKHPQSQLPNPFNPFYYSQQPQNSQPPATCVQQQVTTPASDQKSPKSVSPQTSNGGIGPQGPQLGSLYMQSLYCPLFCPYGFSSCCPQIAFHQHLHIVPAGYGSKDAPSFYQGVPFLSSVTYSEYGNGFSSAPLSQKPVEAATIQAASSALISPSLPYGDEKQPYLHPPDGNPVALPGSYPSKTASPELPLFYAPNALFRHWTFLPQNEEVQNLPQSQVPSHYNEPSKLSESGNEPINPVVQYEPYNFHSPNQQNRQRSAGNANNPPGLNFMSIGQYSQQQGKRTAEELQSFNKKPSDSKDSTLIKIQRELDRFLVPYYMLQDSPAPTYNNSVVPNNSHPFLNGPNNSTQHEQTPNSYSEPKSYVLLQHGPPVGEPSRFSDSPMLFRGLVPDTNFVAHNLARHHSNKPQNPQNVKPLQEKNQNPRLPGEGMSSPLQSIQYMPSLDDESGLPLTSPAPGAPHFVLLPHDPSFSSAPTFHESFKDLWKSLTPLGSSQGVPPHVLGKMFQRRTSATDHQANGLNQPLQTERENQKQR